MSSQNYQNVTLSSDQQQPAPLSKVAIQSVQPSTTNAKPLNAKPLNAKIINATPPNLKSINAKSSSFNFNDLLSKFRSSLPAKIISFLVSAIFLISGFLLIVFGFFKSNSSDEKKTGMKISGFVLLPIGVLLFFTTLYVFFFSNKK